MAAQCPQLNVAKDHCFGQWIKNENIINSLSLIKPPFMDENNKLNIMQLNELQNASEEEQKQNQFGRCKQFLSSSFMANVSAQLQPIAMQHIGKELQQLQLLKIINLLRIMRNKIPCIKTHLCLICFGRQQNER